MTTAVTATSWPMPVARSRSMIAVASGKGGVGKTWLAISLAHALSKTGRRVLLFDGDLGLANVDIQLGLMPANDLGSVLDGRIPLSEATTSYASGEFDVIAGRSGSGRLANISPSRLQSLGTELVSMEDNYDQVILDLGAGIERTVRQLTRAASVCLVVITDEPTSLTDAYAFIKMSHLEWPGGDFRVVVNMARSVADGERTHATLQRACSNFLRISPPLLGVVRRDTKVREAIRHQTSILTRFPNCNAALDVMNLATRLVATSQSAD